MSHTTTLTTETELSKEQREALKLWFSRPDSGNTNVSPNVSPPTAPMTPVKRGPRRAKLVPVPLPTIPDLKTFGNCAIIHARRVEIGRRLQANMDRQNAIGMEICELRERFDTKSVNLSVKNETFEKQVQEIIGGLPVANTPTPPDLATRISALETESVQLQLDAVPLREAFDRIERVWKEAANRAGTELGKTFDKDVMEQLYKVAGRAFLAFAQALANVRSAHNAATNAELRLSENPFAHQRWNPSDDQGFLHRVLDEVFLRGHLPPEATETEQPAERPKKK